MWIAGFKTTLASTCSISISTSEGSLVSVNAARRENPKSEPIWDRAGAIAGAVLATVLLLWLVLGYFASTREHPAEFGDMFGAASALFSGLAFAGLVYTIALQRSELKSQREDLAETRRELHAQTTHFEEQNRTLRQQALVSTFFQLLRLHNEIVNAIDLRAKAEGKEIAKGRDCFKVFVNDLRGRYQAKRAQQVEATPLGCILAAYDDFYEEHQADVGHYFRSLYNMVKLIHRSDLNDKRLYTNLIRGQLSSYEQVLLLYNCVTPLGDKKFKPLIETYGFFKNLNLGLLIGEEHKMYYAAAAFA
jgi:Putative phage abortive infection protein